MTTRKRNVVRALPWVVFLGLLLSPLAFVFHEEPVPVTAQPVTRGHVEQTVSAIASGSVIPRYDALIASEFVGTVNSIPVKEGQRVTQGDVLVVLNHAEADAQVALAEANLRVGASRREQTKLAAKIHRESTAAQVSQTKAQRDLAQLDFNRVKSLFEKRAVARSDLDKASLALRVAQETHSVALAYQRENLVRQEEIRSAEAAIEQLEAAVDVAKAIRDKATVRAPFAGVVARIVTDLGETVMMGVPLVQLTQDDGCYVKAPFDEANAADIRIGQKVRINLDAYRNTDFAGRVEYISPVVSINPDLSRTLTVKVAIEQGIEKFIPGMSVDVTILVDEKNDVLFAPSETLIRERFAYVVEGNRAVRREVVTGVGNWRTREILDGLEEGELLITSVAIKELGPGVKVQIVEELDGR